MNNDEFKLDDLEIDGLPDKKGKAAKPPKAERVIDPEDDRDHWPVIHIEAEEGKPNFEYLYAMGTKKNGDTFEHYLQVRRGENVSVPPSIVYALNDAVATHMRQVKNQATGLNDKIYYERSSLPWRLIKGGKYC